MFYPGLHADDKPLKHANATDLSLGNDDGAQVVVTPSGVELGGNIDDRPTDFVALASLVKAELTKLQQHFAALEAVILLVPGIPEPGNGSPSAFQAALKLAITTPPNTYPAPGDVKSSNVKAK